MRTWRSVLPDSPKAHLTFLCTALPFPVHTLKSPWCENFINRLYFRTQLLAREQVRLLGCRSTLGEIDANSRWEGAEHIVVALRDHSPVFRNMYHTKWRHSGCMKDKELGLNPVQYNNQSWYSVMVWMRNAPRFSGILILSLPSWWHYLGSFRWCTLAGGSMEESEIKSHLPLEFALCFLLPFEDVCP